MSGIDSLIKFFLDEKIKISRKAAIVIITIFSVYLADDLTGFSFYTIQGWKLEQIKSISELKRDSIFLNHYTQHTLKGLEYEIINRKNIFQKAISFIEDSERPVSNSTDLGYHKGSTNANFLFFISTSGLYLIAAFFIPLLIIYDDTLSFIQKLASFLSVLGITLTAAWLQYNLFKSLMPEKILGYQGLTYVANFLLQLMIFAIISYIQGTIIRTRKNQK